MKNRSFTLPVVILVSTVIVIFTCGMPVFAKVNYMSNATYDYDGSSVYPGEEIRVKMTINPGVSEVKDMRITISEADALIDGNSFEKTISPAGAPVNLTREGHTFLCDRLKPGESITLMFNAYPKTEKEKRIKVANVRIEYTQLGQRLEETKEISANLENSAWFGYEVVKREAKGLQNELKKLQLELSAMRWMLYLAIIFGITTVIFCVMWYNEWKKPKIP